MGFMPLPEPKNVNWGSEERRWSKVNDLSTREDLQEAPSPVEHDSVECVWSWPVYWPFYPFTLICLFIVTLTDDGEMVTTVRVP